MIILGLKKPADYIWRVIEMLSMKPFFGSAVIDSVLENRNVNCTAAGFRAKLNPYWVDGYTIEFQVSKHTFTMATEISS